MAALWQSAVLVSLVTALVVDAEVKLDCRPDFVTVVWTTARARVDLSLVRLGTCSPTSVSTREVVFSVEFSDCDFRRIVTGDQLVYTNDLTYMPTTDAHKWAFSHPVVCVYERPKDWYPPLYAPVLFHTYGVGAPSFYMGLMNDDFSGPASSTAFPLGSFIPVLAGVVQMSHQPLLLLLEECVAAATPQLHPESNLYPIITNKGCLVDSKVTHSKFEPRHSPSELWLSLQAFKFAVGEEVFIHCKLVAWDPNGLDSTKKACHYVKEHGWELLDDPSYSHLCSCCDSSCKSRHKRSTGTGHLGMTHNAVLGPLKITDLQFSK
ncbi:zona pellucida sperm-binding protein 3-like [Lampris incognitus]|uniref:zona pellucida sperm-binding protein 3-like n=1 Tax=Lampris incognitus TaxID=2546036 RepID=UPI0024B4FCBB|nr:zona pellucida sperm-binding protein 3-like [Lampris incognitus]